MMNGVMIEPKLQLPTEMLTLKAKSEADNEIRKRKETDFPYTQWSSKT